MTLSEWLDARQGRPQAMAAHFKVTKAAISQWRHGVPMRRLRDVVMFCEGEVSLTELLAAIERRPPKDRTPKRKTKKRKAVGMAATVRPS